MGLSRIWARQLLRASGIALAVPAAVLIALVILAFGGGFGHLTSVSQVLAGPALPAPGHGDSSNSGLVAALGSARSGGRTRREPAAFTGTRSELIAIRHRVGSDQVRPRVRRGTDGTSGARLPSRPSRPPSASSRPRPAPPRTTAPGPGGTPTVPVPPGHPTPLGGPLHGVAGVVRSTTGAVAGAAAPVLPPVGPAAGSAVASVGGTVAAILDGVAGPASH